MTDCDFKNSNKNKFVFGVQCFQFWCLFNACASQKVNARRGVEDASKFTGRTFCSYKYEHRFCLARLERKCRQHAETTFSYATTKACKLGYSPSTPKRVNPTQTNKHQKHLNLKTPNNAVRKSANKRTAFSKHEKMRNDS